MKHIKSILILQLAALCATATIARPAQPSIEVPFRGTVETFEVLDFTGFPTAVISTGAGGGNATHLGKFTVFWEVTINFEVVGGMAVGGGVFTAANGDTINTAMVGYGFPTEDPDVFLIVETQTVVGGTGRFAGATGEFVRESYANLATGFTSGFLEGSLVLDKTN